MIDQPPSPPDEPKSPPPLFDNALSTAVQQSAQQIWLAGMGAFAKAQEEGGRVFEALVREGIALQRKTHAAAEERIVEASSKIGDIAGQAGQQWDRLESIFEERVAKSLNRLGMPSIKDVRALVGRVDSLNEQVEQLSQRLAALAASKPSSASEPAAALAPGDSQATVGATAAASLPEATPAADSAPPAVIVPPTPNRRSRARSA